MGSIPDNDVALRTILQGLLIIVLIIIVIILIGKIITRVQKDNSLFYSEKGAINLRIGRMPTMLTATANCRWFRVVVMDNRFILCYANAFDDIKEFECEIVGDQVEKSFSIELTEANFKKVVFNLKPGPVAIFKHKIIFSYKHVVDTKSFKYIK
jgi:hypothetical protein